MDCGNSRHAGIVLVSGLAVAACGSPAASETAVVQPPRLEHVIDIGCAACGSVEQITPLNVAVTPTGTVIVVDRYEPFVRVFGLDGTPRAAVGTAGEGPGEMTLPVAASAAVDGSIWIFDGLGKMVHVDAEGALLGEVRLPQRLPISFDFDVRRAGLITLAGFFPGTGEPGVDGRTVERWEPGAPDTVTLVANDGLPRDPEEGDRAARQLVLGLAPAGGFVLAHVRTYTIVRYDADGRLVGEFRHDAPRPLLDEEALERARERLRRRGEDPSSADPHDMHFRTVRLDDDDRLWVSARRGGGGLIVFDVFDPEGAPLGELRLERRAPAGYELYALAGPYLAAIVEDDEGTMRIAVWRVH